MSGREGRSGAGRLVEAHEFEHLVIARERFDPALLDELLRDVASIVKVDDDSPAQKGGLLLGDILVALDGQAIDDAEELRVLLSSNRVGKTIPLEIIRGGKLQTLQVTVGQRS